MKLILETDIGRDPDDLFTLLYLMKAGVDIQAILISPGDMDQVALVKSVLSYCHASPRIKVGVPIGALDGRGKRSSGGVHYKLMNKMGVRMFEERADGVGYSIIRAVTDSMVEDDVEFLSIGPVTNLSEFIQWHSAYRGIDGKPDVFDNRITVQGGFCPYGWAGHTPEVQLEKFIGRPQVPSFNPNGNRRGFVNVINSFRNANYVGKNVCHTVEFTPDRVPERSERTIELSCGYKPIKARWLYEDLAEIYFKKHKSKKFHDPTAAVCHLHPEVGVWRNGMAAKSGSGWTTVEPDMNQRVLVDVDRAKLWEHLKELT